SKIHTRHQHGGSTAATRGMKFSPHYRCSQGQIVPRHYIASIKCPRSNLMDALNRAWLSLDGLSVGDAFGERFFGPLHEIRQRISRRVLPDAPWPYTDDTEMALSVVEILRECGSIDQDMLAKRFAERMQFNRGYGRGAYAVLCGVKDGLDW